MKKAKLSLAWQILIGLVLGIAIGAVLNHFISMVITTNLVDVKNDPDKFAAHLEPVPVPRR